MHSEPQVIIKISVLYGTVENSYSIILMMLLLEKTEGGIGLLNSRNLK